MMCDGRGRIWTIQLVSPCAVFDVRDTFRNEELLGQDHSKPQSVGEGRRRRICKGYKRQEWTGCEAEGGIAGSWEFSVLVVMMMFCEWNWIGWNCVLWLSEQLINQSCFGGFAIPSQLVVTLLGIQCVMRFPHPNWTGLTMRAQNNLNIYTCDCLIPNVIH